MSIIAGLQILMLDIELFIVYSQCNCKEPFQKYSVQYAGKNLVRGLALPEQWAITAAIEAASCTVRFYTLAGVHQNSTVIYLYVLGAVLELIEPMR